MTTADQLEAAYREGYTDAVHDAENRTGPAYTAALKAILNIVLGDQAVAE
jgi:hypothetical protein